MDIGQYLNVDIETFDEIVKYLINAGTEGLTLVEVVDKLKSLEQNELIMTIVFLWFEMGGQNALNTQHEDK